MSALCPWCQAPRAEGPACPKCGANYAKAEAIRKGGRAPAAMPAAAAEAPPPEAKAIWQSALMVDPDHAVDSEREWRLCAVAIPAGLLLGLLLALFLPGLVGIVFTMPLHELGHAVAGWLCGMAAVPMLWLTRIPEERSFFVPLLVGGGMGYLAFLASRAEKWLYAGLCAAVLALAALGTFALKLKTANMLITFAGDALGMVFGTLLMASFFFGKGTQLYRGSLRWGFLVIGASAFMHIFSLWWRARKDFGLIPFGEQERAGPSDATRLADWYGWDADQIIQRHVAVGVACLVALALVYAWGTWRAWRYAQEERR